LAALLFVDEFRLNLLQTGHAGHVYKLLHKFAGNAFLAILGQHAAADPADVTFPAAFVLVQRGDGNHFAFVQCQQR